MEQNYGIVWSEEKIQKIKIVNANNERIMDLSKCAVSDSKKARLIKEQEASGSLSSSGIKAPLAKIPSVGPLLF